MIFCGLAFVIDAIFARFALPMRNSAWLPLLFLSGGLLAHLLVTRHRPSERRALVAIVLLWATVLPLTSLNQAHLLALDRPYQPLFAHKMLVVVLGLVAASRLWLGAVLISLTTAVGLAVFVLLDLGAHRALIAHSEPWVFLSFVMIGAGSLVMRAQRRVVSLQLLRAEGEAQALRRHASLFLALRDQLNTPLQTLVLAAAQLQDRHPDGDLAAIAAEIDPLVKLSQQLSALDALIPKESYHASFDAPREMLPQL
jgi:hypothetical protein